jgi:phosphatidylinositol alpha-1,6-mannosyltransferase
VTSDRRPSGARRPEAGRTFTGGEGRVLFLTRNFPPLVGGIERLAACAVDQLGAFFACDVVGPPGCQQYAGVHRGFGCRVSPLGVFLSLSLLHALRLARSGEHRLTIAGSGLLAPVSTAVRGAFGLPAITFVHGLDLAVDHPLYRSLWGAAIRRSELVVANSRYTADLARARGVPSGRVAVLHPPMALPRRAGKPPGRWPDPPAGWPGADREVLLSVGRIVPRKGLAQLLEETLPALVRRHPEVALVIVGTAPKNAVRRYPDTAEQLRSRVREQGLQRHVFFLGAVSDDVLHLAYERARLLLLPLVDVPGDVEGFGMVAVEAAAHGLPTVAFALGGVTDAVAPGMSGYLVRPGDYGALTDLLSRALADPGLLPGRSSCRRFAERFSTERYGRRLLDLCDHVMRQHPARSRRDR